jgi:hypothetical protein
MKKLYLFILFVLLLPVTSSFAIAPPTATGQKIFVPYVQVGNGYWSGLAVHNISGTSQSFTFNVFSSEGTVIYGNSFTVAPYAMEVRLVEGFFSGLMAPTGRMSVVIKSPADGSVPFKATIFVGSDQGGFGFQNYTSEPYTYTPLPTIAAPGD